MPGYDIIAKTGTAQVADKTGYGDTFIRSFAGLYPGDTPSIIVYYAAKDKGANGVSAMKQVVHSLIADVSKYLDLDPKEEDETSELMDYSMPSFVNKTTSSVTNQLDNNGLKYVVIGNGNKIIKQYPNKDVKVSEIDKIFLITNDTNIKMPNVLGYSNSEVKILLDLLEIKYKIEGTGHVISQSIKPNTKINKDDEVSLVLKPKF